ncbi:MAG: DUF2085 domain-containing protein, partial [Methanobacterium sp.]|nr:DUF2085 domain-containing protein [Methanobacterium sp.]
MKIEYTMDKDIGPVIICNFLDKRVGLCFCHKNEERSIKFLKLEKFFCSRCLGVFFGFFIGAFLRIINIEISFYLFILLILPLVVDGTTQAMKL